MVHGYFPEPVTVQWESGTITRGIRTFPSVHHSSSGLYTTTSQLTVPSEGRKSQYHCNVQHRHTSFTHTGVVTPCITKPVPPEVRVLHSCNPRPGETTVELMCLISGFFPVPVVVEWLVNDKPSHITATTATPWKDQTGNTFSTSSKASISMENWMDGKTYTCKVTHRASESTVKGTVQKCESDSSSGIRVYLTPPNPGDLYINQFPKLTCLVVDLPSNIGLQITWTRETGGTLTPDPTEIKDAFNGTYTALSSLPIFPRDWESDTSFVCKVEHTDLPSPITKAISRKQASNPSELQAPEVQLLLHSSCSSKAEESSINLLCLISGFYPSSVTFEWLVDGQTNLVTSITASPWKDANGHTFSTTSKVNITQEEWMMGKTYTCRVTHLGTRDKIQDQAQKCTDNKCKLPTSIHVFLTPPSPHDLYESRVPKITCLVVNLPNDTGLNITWWQKGKALNPEVQVKRIEYNGTTTATSTLDISTYDWESGESYTCHVEHVDLPSPITETISKKRGHKSTPSIYVYHPGQEEIVGPGDSLSLTCLVRGFHPDDISILWKKNNDTVTEDAQVTTTLTVKGKGKNANYFVYSLLTITKVEWDNRDSFTCRAIHGALDMKFIQRTIEKPPEMIVVDDICSDNEDTELEGLWATISVFITLFLLSVCYSATITLFKVKWLFSTVVELKRPGSPKYKNVIQRVI
uniref:Ig-like domain-containing protein n=1 Tax=Sphenodon punctatus TaxID=8508 RepID=A0A8D0G5Y0_SPHPU